MVALPPINAPEGTVEHIARFSAEKAAGVSVVVIVPTFRRPEHLATTLKSVLNQQAAPPFAIVVMDNDAEGREGANAAQATLEAAPVPSSIIMACRRGNCAAYNAGFATALEHYPTATHIQIIDDDEIARPDWLAKMTATASLTGATCTGGPQNPVFEAGATAAMASHPVFRPPYDEAGSVPILYSSGNVLIETAHLRRHGYPWLDERFNFLGGGDSDFFSRSRAMGATFAWEPAAIVDETTPARRTDFSWLNSRALRNGSISAAIQRKAATGTADTLERLAKTALLLAASPYRAAIELAHSGSPAMALNPMLVALGRLLMEFDVANEQYRAAQNN